MNILCVDDDLKVLSSLRRILRMNGWRVHGALSGNDAIRIVNRYKEQGRFEIDAVIIDILMPDMDGLELLSLLRDQHPTLPTMMYTGINSETTKTAALRLGCDVYLDKPAESNVLCLTLSKMLLETCWRNTRFPHLLKKWEEEER